MARRGPRFALGVDLGTTNTVLAWTELGSHAEARVFPIRQRIAADLIDDVTALPSFLAYDKSARAWEVGAFARALHANEPESVIASSKSWLTEPRVDRSSSFLPLETDLDLDGDALPRLSPAEAQSLVLRAVAAAWDAAHPDAPAAEQALVVTIPASFDPYARDLVLRAARSIAKGATLLEEPTAALLHAGARVSSPTIDANDSPIVLVADVGGGTSDFALVRVLPGAAGPVFERVATGRHLLLGGDNIDLALAHRVAEAHESLRKLAPRSFSQLVSECRRAKEALLDEASLESVDVRVVLPGSKLVGGLRTGVVTRAMVDACVLREFFPLPSELAAKPARSAFVGFGLSYERDVAITRHAFEFLDRHRDLIRAPLYLLPNGGSLKSTALVDRLAAALDAFGVSLAGRLPGDDGDLAVALGAAAHARALVEGRSRLRGRLARNLFLRVKRPSGEDAFLAILAAGSAENEESSLAIPDLALRTGERARFELAWTDGAPVSPGSLVGDGASVERLPALEVNVPDAGTTTVPVTLRVSVDDLGCVHLACVSSSLVEPLRCAFESRARAARSVRQARLDSSVLPQAIAATPLLEAAFSRDARADSGRIAKDLWRTLEARLGPRKSWSLSLCRALFDALVGLASARRASVEHERVFWQIAGFALRPGIGADGDDVRVDRLFRLEQERVSQVDDARAWEAYFHAWRRVSFGLDARRQGILFERAELALGIKRQKKPCPHGFDGSLAELAGHLDRVEVRRRAALGEAIFDRCMGGDASGHLRRCLGLLGEREPFPAGHEQALPAMFVERWAELALRESWSVHPLWIEAMGRMARLTRDRRRDVGTEMRDRIVARLTQCPVSATTTEALDAVSCGSVPNVRVLLERSGDELPLGLLLES